MKNLITYIAEALVKKHIPVKYMPRTNIPQVCMDLCLPSGNLWYKQPVFLSKTYYEAAYEAKEFYHKLPTKEDILELYDNLRVTIDGTKSTEFFSVYTGDRIIFPGVQIWMDDGKGQDYITKSAAPCWNTKTQEIEYVPTGSKLVFISFEPRPRK